jgi:hypothetical protein
MTSASTWPGPTEGSCSMSPTIKKGGLVRHRLHERLHQHDIDHGGLVDNQQVTVEPTSSSRWMVLASKPVASVIRFAARPVGAHSRRLVHFAARIRRMALTIVVLPTPGPPVVTNTLDISASRIAATWLSARTRPIRRSTRYPGCCPNRFWGFSRCRPRSCGVQDAAPGVIEYLQSP